ncbi:hypothetical protein F0L74_21800 [Chitinophaga agrisoli]|uniref:Fibrobacter succinogenes major paralogous domain-containing protein n=1 Tax=Chitinophaga agrisoli TaxID=2607653 RepID=A0A5B2VIE6_9BACT|nr:fibrobacter succinogenes major paralogous domain-containing protein [Chitinophaga agrisoli]KAA2238851.1 hypothetical protein F0L74_21800 [Chitinophaga agrisoli]
MKSRLSFLLAIAVGAIVSITSCTKDPVDPVQLPAITTDAVTGIYTDTAVAHATITSDGGSEITLSGVCWSTDSLPIITDGHSIDGHSTDGADDGSFTSKITGLTPGTIYYVRAYTKNASGVAYGQSIRFSTCASDIDGNIYRTVIIGEQLWMQENLRTTHYRNGDAINKVLDGYWWEYYVTNHTGAYSSYNYDDANAPVYGLLYNHGTITDTRNVCPVGWHLPTNEDWQTLSNYLGGDQVAGGKMKEAGTTHWQAPNTGATNSSGFTALPAGNVGYGGFYAMGQNCGFWSDYNQVFSYSVGLYYQSEWIAVSDNGPSILGLSIRCIKD